MHDKKFMLVGNEIINGECWCIVLRKTIHSYEVKIYAIPSTEGKLLMYWPEHAVYDFYKWLVAQIFVS